MRIVLHKKLLLLLSLSGYCMVPAQAAISAVAGTVAYVALETAKSLALTAAMGTSFNFINNKVYNFTKPVSFLADMTKGRFISIDLPKDQVTFSVQNAPSDRTGTITLQVPQELCGKTVKVNLVILNVILELEGYYQRAVVSKKYKETCKFLEEITLKFIKQQVIQKKIQLSELISLLRNEPVKETMALISTHKIISTFHTFLEALSSLERCKSDEEKNEIKSNRNKKLMRVLCQLLPKAPPADQPVPNNVSILIQLDPDQQNAQYYGLAAAFLTNLLTMNYGLPITQNLLNNTYAGASLLGTYSALQSQTQSIFTSLLNSIGAQCSLPNSYSAVNLISTCVGITAAWTATKKQHSSSQQIFAPHTGLINRIKVFGTGMVSTAGSLLSSCWLNNLVNQKMRSGSWPTGIYKLATYPLILPLLLAATQKTA